jgi:hypothetical protein
MLPSVFIYSALWRTVVTARTSWPIANTTARSAHTRYFTTISDCCTKQHQLAAPYKADIPCLLLRRGKLFNTEMHFRLPRAVPWVKQFVSGLYPRKPTIRGVQLTLWQIFLPVLRFFTPFSIVPPVPHILSSSAKLFTAGQPWAKSRSIKSKYTFGNGAATDRPVLSLF